MALRTRSKARNEQSARLAPKVWERHRRTILQLYESHSLAEVMAFMEKEHNFKASKMAYKKKLGRWKTTRKQLESSEAPPDDEEEPDEEVEEVSAPLNPAEMMSPERPSTVEEAPEKHIDRFMSNTTSPSSRTEGAPEDQQNKETNNELASEAIDEQFSSRNPSSPALPRIDSQAYFIPESQVAPEGSHKVLQLGHLHEQFFGTLFGVSTLPPFCEVIGTLASLFDQYANARDLFQLERIISLYDFMLVPSNPVRLRQVIRFCRIASKAENPDEEHARLFVRAISGLVDRPSISISTPRWDLPDDVETAANFWLAGLLDEDTLLEVIAKISRFYAHDRPGLCPGAEPYLVLAKLCKTEEDRWDFVIWTCLEKTLKAVHDRIKSSTLSDEEDRFVTQFFMFLWTRQQGNKSFSATLTDLLEAMMDSKHPSAKFHSIVLHCITMQAAIRKIDHFPIWDFFLSKSFLVMEGLVKSLTSRDCLQLVQDMLCSLSTDIKKRQELLKDDLHEVAPELRKQLATLSWEVVCAITKGGFPEPTTTRPCPNSVENRSRQITAGTSRDQGQYLT